MKRYCLIGLAGLWLAACSDDGPERFAGVVVYDDFPEAVAGADRSEDLGIAHAFVLSAGFANGQAVQYLDLGEVSPVPAKMYVLMRGGEPVEGQFPIVDALPDDAEYSPFWQVVEVEVGSGYRANDIKSLKGLADLPMTETLEAVHCPIVNPDATWVAADLSQTFLVFWGTGEAIPNPYFDASAAIDEVNKPTLTDADATAGDILLTPLWQKRMRAFCWSPEGDVLARRFPLLDEDGVISLDVSQAAMRFDTYASRFGPGGEPGAEPTDFLPVFDRNVGDEGYSPLVLQASVAALRGQPGATSDFDPEEVAAAEPEALLDNPIAFPLALDRFRITVENTTEPRSESELTFLGGFAVVEDGSAPVWLEGEPPATAVVTFAESGDLAALLAGWPVSGRPLGPILDAQTFPGVRAGGSVSWVVLASPAAPLLTTLTRIEEVREGFCGVAEVALYDEELAAVATQTIELVALTPDDAGIGPAPGMETPIGTLTIDLLTAGGTP